MGDANPVLLYKRQGEEPTSQTAQWRIHGGGAEGAVAPPPPEAKFFFFFIALQQARPAVRRNFMATLNKTVIIHASLRPECKKN
jgi:hypothetical protein